MTLTGMGGGGTRQLMHMMADCSREKPRQQHWHYNMMEVSTCETRGRTEAYTGRL